MHFQDFCCINNERKALVNHAVLYVLQCEMARCSLNYGKHVLFPYALFIDVIADFCLTVFAASPDYFQGARTPDSMLNDAPFGGPMMMGQMGMPPGQWGAGMMPPPHMMGAPGSDMMGNPAFVQPNPQLGVPPMHAMMHPSPMMHPAQGFPPQQGRIIALHLIISQQ